ncbi:MAG TPA: hypothetical protein V6D08_06500 [Candidatus Obscuribacterales bacterium]
MSRAIFLFTLMSTLLDRIKLVYVALLGFVVPIGLKFASLVHGVAESQTFEMLTGAVGVAFIQIGLCLGLAGNTSTQSGRGENLPLIFTRPITRASYVLTKWAAITLIGGVLASMQNLAVAALGVAFGDLWSPYLVLEQMLERFLDAGIIAAALLFAMLAKHWVVQVGAIAVFYIWLLGQTLPPVSVAGPMPSGADAAALEGTRLLLEASAFVGETILPTVHIYDSLNAPVFPWSQVLAYFSTLSLYLVAAIAVTNRREFFYGSN